MSWFLKGKHTWESDDQCFKSKMFEPTIGYLWSLIQLLIQKKCFLGFIFQFRCYCIFLVQYKKSYFKTFSFFKKSFLARPIELLNNAMISLSGKPLYYLRLTCAHDIWLCFPNLITFSLKGVLKSVKLFGNCMLLVYGVSNG